MKLAPVAVALSLTAWLIPSKPAHAETLPVRLYDVAQGLANSRVTAIVQARRGDIWFATWDGVSRFDGYQFTNFNTGDGLPGSLVSSIAEDRHGSLWFGTFNTGLARLIDDPAERGGDPSRKFAVYHVAEAPHADEIGALAVDGTNRLWCATGAGIYRADLNVAGPPVWSAVLPGVSVSWPQLLAVEPRGRAWAGDGDGVWEIGDGPPVRHPLPRDAKGELWNVALARGGGLWVSCGGRLWRFVPAGEGRPSDAWNAAPIVLGPNNYVRVLAEDTDDALWIGTFEGLLRLRDRHAVMFTTEQGLPDEKIRALRVDRDGNLWIGTHSGGVAKLPRGGLVNITTSDGLSDRNVMSVVESAYSRVYAVTDRAGVVEIAGGRAHPVPGSDAGSFRDVTPVQDRKGNWWIGDEAGLFFSEGPSLRFDRARRLGREDGLPEPVGTIMAIYRDTDGSIWVGQGTRVLTHIEPEESWPPSVTTVPLPAPTESWHARRLLRDHAGTLWVSSFLNLGRLVEAKIESLAGSQGLPDTQVRALYQDRRGRMWLGHRNRGVSMTEEPDASHPRFRTWTSREGLSSDIVWALGEDDAGRIYVGTARGLDRLDPDTGRIRHFGPADGLAGSIVNAILADDRGRLWISTNGGISVLDPRRERDASTPPPAYISRVAISGQDLALPESGTRRLGELRLPWPRNTIAFAWVGVGFESERGIRYQTRLIGADADWSPPAESRAVNYANLGPGRYTFLVRSVSLSGVAEEHAANVRFRILPPFWRRGWFIVACVLAVSGAAIAVHELRTRRLLALERIRRQIATDLHDDMGSGLAQIAVLSEVAKRHADGETATRLDQVAELARGLRDSMSDIVWAVDPRRDRLADLARRLRQVAYNLFEAEGAGLTFDAPDDEILERVELAPDRKRHLFLAAKEALTNVAKHAEASHVAVELTLAGSRLGLTVRDDGRGFDPAIATEGRGLANLERRSVALHGRLRVESAPGRGTTIHLDVPVR
jgi:ligand-binding sensor domain-containing protein/signal transduction histidine kinase